MCMWLLQALGSAAISSELELLLYRSTEATAATTKSPSLFTRTYLYISVWDGDILYFDVIQSTKMACFFN